MINLSDYFDPVSIEKPIWVHLAEPSTLAHNITINTASKPITDISEYRLAIIGIPDDRRSPNKGSGEAPDVIRQSLYQLSRLPGKIRIADLGNLKKGPSFEDTLAALRDVLLELSENNTTTLLLGGSSAVIPVTGRAISEIKGNYTYSTIDSRIDFVNESKEPDSFNYLSGFIRDRDYGPENFIHIGHQSFLNDPQVVNRFRKLNFELVRIGEARASMQEIECLFRDSDIITLDIAAVRQSDAPGTFAPSPNGFYGEEICLLTRYAGLSDKVSIFGLFEVNPVLDSRNLTGAMAAQIIWFFLEGFAQRQNESLAVGKENSGRYVRYHVSVKDIEEDLIFVKSNVTNRWWIEYRNRKGVTSYLACSYNDYIRANENEIPHRWLQAVARNG
ncbi:MAG: hypothetical protein E4G95_06720 [Bacteroidia bacterium]|nr:MAG: hypothetical protein E4G95_06720 [Bacteroidia bacterium]